MSGMDDAVRLDEADIAHLTSILTDAVGPVLLAVDDIDGAVKVKTGGRWSPPIGMLAAGRWSASAAPVVDSGRSNRDDEHQEARVLRPHWGRDLPDPSEYRDLDGQR